MQVCYSWWVLASLAILGRVDWINGEKLSQFILSCQVCICREGEIPTFH